MNELDAKAAGFARRVNFNFISIEPNGAGVSLDHSAEDLHQRRFSGSVLANQGHNFALVDFQIYLFQRDNAGKALADSGHFEKWVGHRSEPPAVASSGSLGNQTRVSQDQPPATEG